MQSEPLGGYIVVGADDHGKTVSDLSLEMSKLFDEASLRPKLERYLHKPIVQASQHVVGDNAVVLIYIAPSPTGWCTFKAAGEYEDAQNRKQYVFRVGEVFVRHGTSSERWNDTDVARLVDQIVERRKEAWRAELRSELAGLQTGLTVKQLEQLPASALNWQLDEDAFTQLVTEMFRHDDDIPIRQLLTKICSDATEYLDDENELSTLLNRLTTIGALAIQFERSMWLSRTVDTFVRMYELGFDGNGYDRQDTRFVRLWLAIITHVYALGSLAVRLGDWQSVRLLANRRPQAEAFNHYGSWLRHALTMASRANQLDDEGAQGLIAKSHNVIRAVTATHPDRDADHDAILNSLCQFDALGCLIVIGERSEIDSRNFYPSFARYYNRRSDPAFVGIITKPKMRIMFNGDDRLLADAIQFVADQAGRELIRYGSWSGIHSKEVREFIAKHKSTNTQV